MSAVAADETLTAAEAARHPGLELLCARLEAILHGQAAQEILDAGELPADCGVVTLPAWSWVHPLIDVGRKDRAYRTGARLLMPIRNDWDTPLTVLVGTESVPLTYRSRGMGHSSAGQSRIVRRPGARPVTAVEALPCLAEPVFAGTGGRHRAQAALKDLVAAGKAARWELLTELEPKLKAIVQKAHSSVSYEIGLSSGVVEPMLDDLGLDQVVDTMMYGEEKEDGARDQCESAIFRLIELCLQPDCFLRVDPLRYMVKHMRRDAEAQIRRRLGDPHIGPKIREIARRHPRADISVIVEAYREVYPKDRLSVNRAQAALSVSPSVAARSVWLTHDAMDIAAPEGAAAA